MRNDFLEHFIDQYESDLDGIEQRLFRENSHVFNKDYLAKFIKVGKDLYAHGFVTSHGGNLSVSDGEDIWITRAGAQIGALKAEDIVMTTWDPYEDEEGVSSEMAIHHAIYAGLVELAERRNTAFGTMSIIHALPPQTIFRTFVDSEIPSVSYESLYVLGEKTPVIEVGIKLEDHETEQIFQNIVAGGTLAVAVRGHGVFAAGRDLDDAMRLVTSLEQTCTLLNLFDATGRTFDPSILQR